MLKHELRQRREEERQRHALIMAVVVFALALTVYFLSQSEPVQRRYLYPYPYQELVELYAKANGVDSALVASVIMNESRFQNDARSSRATRRRRKSIEFI